MAATKTEQSVRERMAAEKKELQAEQREVAKSRTAACKEWDKAFADFNKKAEAAIKCDDAGKTVDAAEHEAARVANERVLQAMNKVIGTGNRVALINEKLATLEDPKELARRVELAERLGALPKRNGSTKEGDTLRAPSAKEIAVAVLRDAGAPLHYREITRLALDSGQLTTKGKTPEATMNAMLATSAKAEDTFVKVSPGVFALRDEVVAEATA